MKTCDAETAMVSDALSWETRSPLLPKTGFRAFTAVDWERIETVTPHMRRVGQMMKAEALALVTGEQTRAMQGLNIDSVTYAYLCSECNLSVHSPNISSSVSVVQNQHKQDSRATKKKGNTKKNDLKDALDKRARALDIEKIKNMRSGTCPRWEYAETRPEAYIVAFRIWLASGRKEKKQSREAKMDKLVSCEHLLRFLANEAQITMDILGDISSILADLSFAEALEIVAQNESLLTAPSFTSSRTPLTLYTEQREVATSILTCMQDRLQHLKQAPLEQLPALLLRFCTPPSTGKSSAAAYLGAMIEIFNRDAQKYAPPALRRMASYVVYECYSESVRFDVAKMCVAAAIPFAIFSDCLASPSYSCYSQKRTQKKQPPPEAEAKIAYSLELMDQCDNRPVVLVCDPISAIYLLQLRMDVQTTSLGDVLLLDEPTDCISEEITMAHANILANAPAMTVLMSATCPDFTILPAAIAHLRTRFGDALRLRSVTSNRITSPCTVVDARGNAYAPHRVYRRSCGELHTLLSQHLHLKRLYSPRAALQLVCDLPGSETEATEFVKELSALKACSSDSIREVALSILSACTPSLQLWGDISQTYCAPTTSLLCTTDAHLLPGVSFILSNDEDALREASLSPLSSLGEKLDKRLQQQAQERARMARMRMHEDSGRDDTKSKEDRLSRQRELDDIRGAASSQPLWPHWLCINTTEHMKVFARGGSCETKMAQQVPLVPNDVLSHSCEVLAIGLLCGFCTLHSSRGDRALTLASQILAENKSFSYLNGGRSSIFGVNLPCDRIILLFDSESVSPEEIVQCMGRCGRTGKFSRSEALFASSSLLEYVFHMYDGVSAMGACRIDRLLQTYVS